MNSLPTLLESTMRVHHHDCDPFHHLNNSRYIDYLIAARTEQLLDAYNFDTAAMARQGIGWVVAETQIAYLRPATWFETVRIETRLLSFSSSSLLVEALMWDEAKSHPKAVMWTKLVHFSISSKRSLPHSDELLSFFSQVQAPLPEQPTFAERVQSVKPLYS
ncbi:MULTISPECIES: thioesterase family protein [unclassified Flavobacterium]|uniref:acyl-CoA thioesterase n=1 Tax=unclassified Flavobacterium TaxID=196869 RepID=UPI001F146653|nr:MULTISPECIES: acyl-CoA thioesterase [unclassified Flavobacterium]UMY65101.1 acyl-CoA thioesterase [Flavobacterium sp. HJ-32-4]